MHEESLTYVSSLSLSDIDDELKVILHLASHEIYAQIIPASLVSVHGPLGLLSSSGSVDKVHPDLPSYLNRCGQWCELPDQSVC